MGKDRNPEWIDLCEEIGVDAAVVKEVKRNYKIAGQACNDSL